MNMVLGFRASIRSRMSISALIGRNVLAPLAEMLVIGRALLEHVQRLPARRVIGDVDIDGES